MSAPPLVKICGVRTPADVDVCLQEQVAFVGLNLFPTSPRYVDWDHARALRQRLAPTTQAVAVMVRPTSDEVTRAVREVGVNLVQLHGVDADYLRALRIPAVPLWLACGVASPDDLQHIRDLIRVAKGQNLSVTGVLVDAKVEGAYGGTGATPPWPLLAQVPWDEPLILAGGLSPSNVSFAVEEVHPYAVDVASGVECQPGIKDAGMIRAFTRAARGPQ